MQKNLKTMTQGPQGKPGLNGPLLAQIAKKLTTDETHEE
jgi:hypothetical protein